MVSLPGLAPQWGCKDRWEADLFMSETASLSVMTFLVGVLAAALLVAVGLGVNVPVVGNGRGAFIALAVMAAIMCKRGVTPWRGFSDPFTIAGTILGIFNLLLIAAVLFRIRLPLITSDRAATLLLGASMAVKVVMALVRASLR